MCEQQDTSLPINHHADYIDRNNWGTNKTRNIHRVVHSLYIALYIRHCASRSHLVTSGVIMHTLKEIEWSVVYT